MEEELFLRFGEVEPADKRNAVAMARFGFLETIRLDERASVVLSELAGAPYHSFIEAGFNPEGLWPITDDEIGRFGTQLYKLRRDLLHWAGKWHLDADWCLDNACWTLWIWRETSNIYEPQQWSSGGLNWIRLPDAERNKHTPPFNLHVWDADSELRESYIEQAELKIKQHIEQDVFLADLSAKLKKSIADEARAKVAAYCDNVLKVYYSQVDTNGNPVWMPAESKRELKRNLEWAVKFQVLETKFSDIASEENVAVSTVKRAVEDALDLIGLPKRKDARPGRPYGSKESPNSWRRSIKRAGIPK